MRQKEKVEDEERRVAQRNARAETRTRQIEEACEKLRGAIADLERERSKVQDEGDDEIPSDAALDEAGAQELRELEATLARVERAAAEKQEQELAAMVARAKRARAMREEELAQLRRDEHEAMGMRMLDSV